MNHYYKDILEKIDEEPQWFDEHAVPRFCPYSPDEVADIYADEVAFFEIACQNCGYRFIVAASSNKTHRQLIELDSGIKQDSIKEIIDKYGEVFWHDPPNIRCCGPGPTMTSDFIKILEYWHRDGFDWKKQTLKLTND